MKTNKTTITIGILILLLISAAGYIINEKLIVPGEERQKELYMEQGARLIIDLLIEELVQCKQVSLQLNNNQTVNAILVECLNQNG